MGVGALVRVTAGVGVDQLAQDDDAGGAAVDAEGATGAHVVVDDEDGVVGGVEARELGADGLAKLSARDPQLARAVLLDLGRILSLRLRAATDLAALVRR